MIIKGKIEKREMSNGTAKTGKPYVRVMYVINDKNYSTFDDKFFPFAIGDEVEIETKTQGKYENMISMKKIEPQASNAQIQPKQEFHQSIEACRFEALDIALKAYAPNVYNKDFSLFDAADVILAYILKGEKPEKLKNGNKKEPAG